ncbi:SPL family radical SAM protein [Mesobacillus subterraneus]|uniref:Radical SAM protein n=1 Tax=Mesobacillus subterraneus TaxID=285983 RepID=A0A427TQI1_9BACI|nr:radical SAM protein [Mesobacillus subterraneus]RSD26653.1 radical SAM protein [Mesobacillus subterraneus]
MKQNVKEIVSKSILTKGTGLLNEYSHSLNPYAGCAFSCSYCYVREFPVSLFRDEEWGTWIDIKANAAELLRKELIKAKKKGAVTIFMSSATDPYQPIESKTLLTRSLLEVMLENPPDFLFVQTRSPLVTRDLDVFKRFGDRLRVSMTIETDKEEIRKAFAPTAPPIQARMNALKTITEAGVLTQATISPLLPCSREFPKKLKGLANRIAIDDFWMGDGSGGRRTARLGISKIYDQFGMGKWYNPSAYKVVLKMLKDELGEGAEVLVSQHGFSPGR